MLKDKRVIGFASLAIGVIVILNFAFFSKAGAGFWTEITMLPSDQQWYSFTSFTSSADGTKLIAGSTGNVFTSSDSGATWNEQVGSGPRVWKQIISSADGNTLFAIQFSFSPTYMLKSVDGGATWTDVIDAGLFNNGLTEWGQITMSADGTKVAARRFSGPGVVYTSSDGGTTWNERNGLTFNPVGSIAYSPDGSKLVFTTYSGFGNHRLYISTDDGLTETDVSAALAAPIFWNYDYGIAMSYDGSIIYVAGGRFVSQDGGTTWTDRGSGVGGLYLGSSYDGLVLLAINGSDTPFSGSSDGGETWVEYSPFDQDAVAGAITSNGLKLYVTLTTGQIYVADTNASIPVITMTSPSEGQTIPSWNPNINWGASGACSYSYDNITFTPTSCFTNTVPLDPNVSASTSYIYLRGENHSGVTNLVRTYVFELPVTWTTQVAAGDQEWIGVAASTDGTKVVAVNSSGDVSLSSDGGTSWAGFTDQSIHIWRDIAVSGDGTKVIASVNGGYLYGSSDNGATLTEQTSAGTGSRVVAMSSNGTKMAAVEGGRHVYTSVDSGATWTEQTASGQRSWRDVAISADGLKIVAVEVNASIHTSEDGGNTWTEQVAAGSRNWSGVASSDDGSFIVAVPEGDYIYTSSDSGATWTEQTASDQRDWSSVDTSSDGLKVVATDYNYGSGGYIYTSEDGGATWTEQTASGVRNWYGVTLSSNGLKIAAYEISAGIHTSNDGGITWTEQVAAGSKTWTGISSSNSGNKIFAVEDGNYSGGRIHVSLDGGVTWTEQINGSILPSGTSLACSSDCDFIIVGSFKSYDGGITWESQSMPAGRVAISGNGLNVVTSGGGSIYTSNDSAVTFVEQIAAGSRLWTSVAVSDDGTRIVAVASGEYIYTSEDGGVTWTEQTASGQRDWQDVAVSADGLKIVAVDYNYSSGGYIYTSEDGGVTWTEQTTLGAQLWSAVASSSDGETLAVVYLSSGSGGKVYLSADGGATWEEHLSGSSWTDVTVSDDGRIFFLTDDSSCDGSCE